MRSSFLLSAALVVMLMNPMAANAQSSGRVIPIVRIGASTPYQETNQESSDQADKKKPRLPATRRIENHLRPIHQVTADKHTALSLESSAIPAPTPIAPPVGEEPARSTWYTGTVAWQIPDMCHRHLYFEDCALERYGYSYGIWQPALSGIRFVNSAATFPLKLRRYPYRATYYRALSRFNDSQLFGY